VVWAVIRLERQADTRFEIAAIVTDADIATQVDDFVAEFILTPPGSSPLRTELFELVVPGVFATDEVSAFRAQRYGCVS